MPKNDFTAQAGISLEQWKKDIASMNASLVTVGKQVGELNQEMNRTSQATASTAKSAGFLAGSLKLIGGALAVRKVVQFGQAAAEMGVEINDAARQADVSAESFQQLQRATEGTLSKGEFTSAINSVTQALDAARSGSAGAADSLQEIGVSIQTINNGRADQAFLEIADRAGKAAQSVAQLNKVFGENARAVKETVAGGGGAIRERMGVSAVSAENAQSVKEAGRFIKGKLQGFMSSATNLAGEISAKIAGTGDYSAEGPKKWENRFHEPKGKIEEKKKASSENIVDVAKSQKELLMIHEKTDISLESQLKVLLAETNVLTDQLALSEKQNGVNSIATLQLRAQVHERALAYNNVEHQILMTKAAAENATTQLDAQLAGNKVLAELTKTRLDFEQKIAQAVHEKRDDVANELRIQQAMTQLAIKTAQQRKTPKDIRAERKEQDANDRAARIVMRRELARDDEKKAIMQRRAKFGKNRVDDARLAEMALQEKNGNPFGFADGRNHRSKITDEMRAEFNARQVIPEVKGIKDAKKRELPAAPPADKKINEFKAQTLIVTQIKSQ